MKVARLSPKTLKGGSSLRTDFKNRLRRIDPAGGGVNSTGMRRPVLPASASRLRFVASIVSPATYSIGRPRRSDAASTLIASSESLPG